MAPVITDHYHYNNDDCYMKILDNGVEPFLPLPAL